MMRLSFLGLFLLTAALATGSTGCERPLESAASSPGATSGQPSEQAGAPCRRDNDCDGYYRCFDQVCTVPPAMTGEVRPDTPRAIFRNEAGDVLAQFHLELAISRDEQSRGLMYRPQMLDEWGMLFIYPGDQPLSFWMKNTLIELDMIFINDSGTVVGVVERAEPETLTPRRVDEPSRFVLEVNGGLARRHGIERGAQMSLSNVEDHHQPRN